MENRQLALRYEYFTVGWNLLEAGIAIGFGLAAASVALVGFGLDSIFESLSGLVLIWRLTGSEISRTAVERKERRAVQLVGLTFLLLAGYIVYEAITKLTGGKAPEPSLPGIVLALVSLTVMPWLAFRKRDLGTRLGSRALIADSKETFACAWLSAALLLGLGANFLWDFWQADPLAGLVIAAFLGREGFENISGHDT